MESKRFGLVKLIEQPCCNLLESGRETWITEHSVAHSKPLSCTQLWETITYCITLEDFPTHRLVSQEGNEWANKCGRLCHKSCLLNHICIGILLEKYVPMIGSCPVNLDVNYRAADKVLYYFLTWYYELLLFPFTDAHFLFASWDFLSTMAACVTALYPTMSLTDVLFPKESMRVYPVNLWHTVIDCCDNDHTWWNLRFYCTCKLQSFQSDPIRISSLTPPSHPNMVTSCPKTAMELMFNSPEKQSTNLWVTSL